MGRTYALEVWQFAAILCLFVQPWHGLASSSPTSLSPTSLSPTTPSPSQSPLSQSPSSAVPTDVPTVTRSPTQTPTPPVMVDLGALIPPISGFKIIGEASGDNAHVISDAGDFNGDGINDFVIGAPYHDHSGYDNPGAAYLIFGKADVPGGADYFDLTTLDGTNGFKMTIVGGWELLGADVSLVGDLNNDGKSDIAVGADRAATNGGEVYIVYGGANAGAATLSLNSLDGSNGFRINANAAGDYCGQNIAREADFNGDGKLDLAISCTRANAQSGQVYVVFSNAWDGNNGNIYLSNINGTNGYKINGRHATGFGTCLDSAGDFNGDGVDDLIIGADWVSYYATSGAGEAYIIYGGNNNFQPEFELSDLNPSRGFALTGVTKNGKLGHTCQKAGDLNGDGFSDAIVGEAAEYAAGNSVNAGNAYILWGTSTLHGNMTIDNLNSSRALRLDTKGRYDYVGCQVAGGYDINGDGTDDVAIAAHGDSLLGRVGNGVIHIIYGDSNLYGQSYFNLSHLNGTNGYRIAGETSDDRLGRFANSLRFAGDINNDGTNDILIGTQYDTNYVVYGAHPGPTKSPTFQPSTSPVTHNPSSISPTTLSPETTQPTRNPTHNPTSIHPSTFHPSSLHPSTSQPSTSIPSASPTSNPSSSPSTVSPSTSTPSTTHPVSWSPTSVSPITSNPTTIHPTSKSPSTCSPTTDPTHVPTRAPSRNPLTKNPLLPGHTSDPTNSPTSRNPATSMPSTISPTSSSPSTKSPSHSPVSETPTTNSPSTSIPTSNPSTNPTTCSPSTTSPETGSPQTSMPTANPSTVSPSSSFPSSNPTVGPTSSHPGSSTPTSTSPVTQTPSSLHPSSSSPSSHPFSVHPGTSSPATYSPITLSPFTLTPVSKAPASLSPTSAPVLGQYRLDDSCVTLSVPATCWAEDSLSMAAAVQCNTPEAPLIQWSLSSGQEWSGTSWILPRTELQAIIPIGNTSMMLTSTACATVPGRDEVGVCKSSVVTLYRNQIPTITLEIPSVFKTGVDNTIRAVITHSANNITAEQFKSFSYKWKLHRIGTISRPGEEIISSLDGLKNPTLAILKQALEPGESYQVQFFSNFSSFYGESISTNATFKTDISPLVAAIDGGDRTINYGSGLRLSATSSHDPDEAQNSVKSFTWTCSHIRYTNGSGSFNGCTGFNLLGVNNTTRDILELSAQNLIAGTEIEISVNFSVVSNDRSLIRSSVGTSRIVALLRPEDDTPIQYTLSLTASKAKVSLSGTAQFFAQVSPVPSSAMFNFTVLTASITIPLSSASFFELSASELGVGTHTFKVSLASPLGSPSFATATVVVVPPPILRGVVVSPSSGQEFTTVYTAFAVNATGQVLPLKFEAALVTYHSSGRVERKPLSGISESPSFSTTLPKGNHTIEMVCIDAVGGRSSSKGISLQVLPITSSNLTDIDIPSNGDETIPPAVLQRCNNTLMASTRIRGLLKGSGLIPNTDSLPIFNGIKSLLNIFLSSGLYDDTLNNARYISEIVNAMPMDPIFMNECGNTGAGVWPKDSSTSTSTAVVHTLTFQSSEYATYSVNETTYANLSCIISTNIVEALSDLVNIEGVIKVSRPSHALSVFRQVSELLPSHCPASLTELLTNSSATLIKISTGGELDSDTGDDAADVISNLLTSPDLNCDTVLALKYLADLMMAKAGSVLVPGGREVDFNTESFHSVAKAVFPQGSAVTTSSSTGSSATVYSVPNVKLVEGDIQFIATFIINSLQNNSAIEHCFNDGNSTRLGNITTVTLIPINNRTDDEDFSNNLNVTITLPTPPGDINNYYFSDKELPCEGGIVTECGFWNYTEKRWSNKGCETKVGSDGILRCACSHLTDFAVVARQKGVADGSVCVHEASEEYLGWIFVPLAGLFIVVAFTAGYKITLVEQPMVKITLILVIGQCISRFLSCLMLSARIENFHSLSLHTLALWLIIGLPYGFSFWCFSFNAFQWISVVQNVRMSSNPFARWKYVFLTFNIGIVTISFLCFALYVFLELQILVIVGSAVVALVTNTVGGLVWRYGYNLSKMVVAHLKKGSKVSGAKLKLSKRLLKTSTSMGISFFLQSVCCILAALLYEKHPVSLVILTVMFHFLEILAVSSLLVVHQTKKSKTKGSRNSHKSRTTAKSSRRRKAYARANNGSSTDVIGSNLGDASKASLSRILDVRNSSARISSFAAERKSGIISPTKEQPSTQDSTFLGIDSLKSSSRAPRSNGVSRVSRVSRVASHNSERKKRLLSHSRKQSQEIQQSINEETLNSSFTVLSTPTLKEQLCLDVPTNHIMHQQKRRGPSLRNRDSRRLSGI